MSTAIAVSVEPDASRGACPCSTGARLLGRDVALLLSAQSRQLVLAILADSTTLAGRMTARAFDLEAAFVAAQQLLEMLAMGIAEAS